MHPEILRQLADHQLRERLAQAHRHQVARTVGKALRKGHYGTTESDGFVTPRIPDYVDGSFKSQEALIDAPAARAA